ncbi:MAG: peptide chain release factor N(5)-glutamine methyltransferase [Gammaproteobacteria bacterium]|nr:peptide chain release factor N(5)-glutamine methyltransferase [Gammaproteobacteria bacterium]
MNIQQALQQASQALSETSPSAVLDAQVLLTHVLSCNTAHLAAWPEKDLSEEQISQYLQLIQQRKKGMPVAHLTGLREFWSLNFNVDDSTLIPRPETETLVEYILNKFGDKKNLKLLDMGTGTGAIAIALAREKPGWKIFASDIAEQALNLARQNSKRHQTSNTTFIHSDWFSDINDHDFDIIISNPPYIADDDPHLLEGDVRFEPQSALASGAEGMDDIDHICLHAKNHLVNNGWLIVEHGYNQKQLVSDCFAENGYTQIEQKKDLSDHTRMTAGKKL